MKVCMGVSRFRKLLFMLAFALTILIPVSDVYASSTANSTIVQYMNDNAPVYDSNGNIVREGTSGWTGEISSYFALTQDSSMGAVKVVAVTYSGNTTSYYYSTASEADIIVAISNTDEGDKVNQQISDITEGLNIQADTAGATQIVSGVSPFVNLLAGLMVVIVIMLLALYTGSDLLFLAFPVFRTFSENKLTEGGNNAYVKTNKQTGEAEYRFISDDAVRAYKASTMDGGSKQPYLKYFISRLGAYVSLAILITVLLTGNVNIFIELGVKAGNGIVEFIKQI